ncbi:hypothetical protein GF373_17205 [bacterium]|nr:hypothetical protein [bacterium]
MEDLTKYATRVYDQEYFSGSQVFIYLGDVFIDEITTFQVEVTQSKTPLFGYASELWDAIANGPKIVKGAFSINFKEEGYMFTILDYYREQKGKNSVLNPYRPNNSIARANIERVLSLDEGDERLYKFYHNLGNYASEKQTSGSGIDRAENLFEAFEDAIWKNTKGLKTSRNSRLASRTALNHKLNGFNIYIQFGDFTNDLANHTLFKIEDVHLVGDAMSIVADGQPVQEVYSFIARNKI